MSYPATGSMEGLATAALAISNHPGRSWDRCGGHSSRSNQGWYWVHLCAPTTVLKHNLSKNHSPPTMYSDLHGVCLLVRSHQGFGRSTSDNYFQKPLTGLGARRSVKASSALTRGTSHL